ncbi:hypothetical protein BC936DRAFT_146778 [Jimgerdemannia flammicorona]|uniref:SET domain-containing protein n=1 Tax=Jimgerdemannia flammicorona TaxID=994334 RepID=A0A433DL87_9FUNG|nr:hypothetical protein BC936DRAFT_146778 [Jimgerdemannia flammicorona]
MLKNILDRKDIFSYTNTLVERHPHTPNAALRSLKRTTFTQLRLGEVHLGQVLVCRTIVKPFKAVSVMVVAEDPIVVGDSAPTVVGTGRLALYNFVDFSGSHSDMSRWLPVGTILFIKEPYYKMANDGLPMVRCDDPAGVIVVPDSVVSRYSILAGLRWADTLPTSPMSYGSESVSNLQRKGTEHLDRKDYISAIDYFTKALKLEPKNVSLLLSRAQAHLLLQQFQQVLKDVEAAVKIDGYNTKIQLLRAEALLGLKQNAEASEILEKLAQVDAGNAKVGDLLRKIREAGMYKSGHYDIISIFQEARSTRPPYLNHADYVGPVRVAEIPRKGPRIVATGDIEEGTLLLCSKAYAVAFGSELPASTVSQSGLVTRVACRLQQEPWTAADLYKLYAGSTTSHAFIERHDAKKMQVDMNHITNIVRVNAFVPDVDRLPRSSADSSEQARPSDPGKGLWLLPSFLHHSCFANALHLTIGDLLFVRAMRHIAKDEEVSVTFMSVLEPYYKRRRFLQERGLGECVCQLCISERVQQPRILDRRVQLLHEFDKMRGDVEAGGPDVLTRLKKLVSDLRMTYPRAEHLLQKQLQISMIRPLSALADLLSNGDYEEALSVLLELVEIEPRCGEIAHKRVDTAMRIAKMYHALKKIDGTKQWMDVSRKECEVIYGIENGGKIWEMYIYTRIGLI